MATLTFNTEVGTDVSTTTRSTMLAAASRPRLTTPLSCALAAVAVSGGRSAVSASMPFTAVSMAVQAPSAMQQVSRQAQVTNPSAGAVQGHDHKSINPTDDVVALLDSRKPCGAVDDRGAGMSRKGAFVISLESRPPSPPVL